MTLDIAHTQKQNTVKIGHVMLNVKMANDSFKLSFSTKGGERDEIT